MKIKMKFLKANNYQLAVKKIKKSMATYYDNLNLHWDDEKKLNRYKECSLWNITVMNEQVGFYMIYYKDKNIYLAELHIDEEYRNRGYGGEALNKIKEKSSAEGYAQIRVGAFKNSPAKDLYMRSGFSLEKETQYTYELVSNT